MDSRLVPVFVASVEAFVKSAATRQANIRNYLDKLEDLDMLEYKQDLDRVFQALARHHASKHIRSSDGWDYEDAGDEREVEGSTVMEVLPDNRDPQYAAEDTVYYYVSGVPEWIDASVDVKITNKDLTDALKAQFRSMDSNIKSLLEDKKSRDYIHHNIKEHMIRYLMSQDATVVLKRMVAEWAREEIVVTPDGPQDLEIDSNEYGTRVDTGEYRVGDGKANKGDMVFEIIFRGVVDIFTGDDKANPGYQPHWLRVRKQERGYDY